MYAIRSYYGVIDQGNGVVRVGTVGDQGDPRVAGSEHGFAEIRRKFDREADFPVAEGPIGLVAVGEVAVKGEILAGRQAFHDGAGRLVAGRVYHREGRVLHVGVHGVPEEDQHDHRQQDENRGGPGIPEDVVEFLLHEGKKLFHGTIP